MVWSERGFIGWFGVRGDLLGGLESEEIYWVVWSERGFIGWFGVRGDLLGGLE